MPIIIKSFGQGGDGDPGETIFGRSVPTGIESQIEYNGLVLNDRKGENAYVVTEISGLEDATLRDQSWVNANDHGERPGTAFYGSRTIVLSGHIRASQWEWLRFMQQELKRAFNDLQIRELIFHTNNLNRDFKVLCRKGSSLVMSDQQNDFRIRRDFQISLKAFDPRMYAVVSRTGVAPLVTGGVSVTCINFGDFPAQPRFDIYGRVDDLTIFNSYSGQHITIDGTIAAGDRWTLDMATKTLTTAAGTNVFSHLSTSSDALVLLPGTQDLQMSYTTVDANALVRIFYSDTYL
jgi:hypothetical protein